MNSLSFKFSLLFVGLALLCIGVLAIWSNQVVNARFASYCEMHNSTCMCLDQSTGAIGLGIAEKQFLEDSQRSLAIAAAVVIAIAILLGFVVGSLVTRPMRQLASSAQRIASGDMAQRVGYKSDDEVGEVSRAFDSMAEQLDKKEKSRKQLLADIAHELRNPLSIVQGNLEAWLDGVITPTPEQIASVYDETVLLNRLIADLRELSLAEAGQLRLNPQPTDLEHLITAEVSVFQARAQEKAVNLSPDLATNCHTVNVDPDRMRQVLHNLLENALRFTPAGGKVIVTARQAGEKAIQVSVYDTGTGIEPADLPYVFDHFYKADKSRQRMHGGAGIGLALVKKFVEMHGGRVWVESEPGRGSTFSFTIPL